MLYGLFQKFIRFDEVFKDTLWADVDLEACNREVSLEGRANSIFKNKTKIVSNCNNVSYIANMIVECYSYFLRMTWGLIKYCMFSG